MHGDDKIYMQYVIIKLVLVTTKHIVYRIIVFI